MMAPYSHHLYCALRGSCRSSVLNARVLGVYGCLIEARGIVPISHGFSSDNSDNGDPPPNPRGICEALSSLSSFRSSRCCFDGIMEYMLSTRFAKKIPLIRVS